MTRTLWLVAYGEPLRMPAWSLGDCQAAAMSASPLARRCPQVGIAGGDHDPMFDPLVLHEAQHKFAVEAGRP